MWFRSSVRSISAGVAAIGIKDDDDDNHDFIVIYRVIAHGGYPQSGEVCVGFGIGEKKAGR